MESLTARAPAPSFTAGWHPHKRSDFALVELARDGIADAFSEIMQRYQAKLARHCGRYLDNEADIDDVVQLAFVNAYRHLDRYEPRYQFATWLFRIATNACIDLLREKKRRARHIVYPSQQPPQESGAAQDLEGIDETYNPERERERKELAAAIKVALAELPARQRDAFCAREFDGLRYDEIAKRLGVSVGAVKSRIFNARQALMKRLAPFYS